MWKKKKETTSGASGQGDRQKPKTVCAFPNGEKCTCGSPQCFQVGTI